MKTNDKINYKDTKKLWLEDHIKDPGPYTSLNIIQTKCKV